MFARCFLIAVVLCNSLFVEAQEFGGNPPSIKWQQINTDTARIIFPQGMDSVAQRVAAVVHYLAAQNPAKLGDKIRKVNIVLQTQTTISNAYVGLAPFRSEYFLTPSTNNFDLGSLPWADGLAVHEYRHVEQYNNFDRGLSKAMHILFGESGLVVAINGAIPDWFYEGDAVYNETITTGQGRGRMPSFLNQYKSLWQANKNYSWMKLRNGSLKDYVPNHYPLGYLLVNYGREKYGVDFWSKVTQDASAFKGLVYPFQQAIKKHAGVDYKTFTKEAFDYYKKMNTSTSLSVNLQQKINQETEAGIKNITPLNTKFVTNYYWPYQLGSDSILYLKSSYRELPAFYIHDGEGEHRLRLKDIALDEQYSYRNEKIVYAAYETDLRWNWRDYSVIKLYDLQKHTQRTITHQSKYFSPDISEDGQSIAAVQIFPGGKSELHLLDANTGKVKTVFHSAEINVFTDPKFADDKTIITAVRLNDGRMTMAIVDIISGAVERLLPPTFAVLGNPWINNDTLYFTASYNSNDELYALMLKDKKLFRLTNTSLGNYNVNVKNGKMIWSHFTAEGFQLQQQEIQTAAWTLINPLALSESPVLTYPISHEAELSTVNISSVLARNFNASKYKQGSHLFYPHSWRPYFEDPDYYYSIYSDNILNTLSTELFYHYNRDEHTHGGGLNFLYGSLFTHINGSVEFTGERPVAVNNTTAYANELKLTGGLSLPLNFTKGRSFNFLTVGTNYGFSQLSFTGAYKNLLGNVNYSYLHHYISISQQRQRARQHIFPRLGYSASLNYRHAITNYNSYQTIANASLYLPGFATNHSIVFGASFQQRDTTNILFSNRFSGARGYYEDYYFSRMWRMSANYHFPIWHTDWGFANLLYIQRFRGNIFYDFEKVYSKDKTQTRDLASAGAEFYFDTKWWNAYPLTFGVRMSHLFKTAPNSTTYTAGSNWFEILVPIVIPN